MVETGLSKDVSVFLLLSPIYLGFVDRSPLLYHLLKSQLCEILIMTKHLQYYWHSHQPQLYSCWLGSMFRCCCIDAQYIMSQHCIWSYTQISEELLKQLYLHTLDHISLTLTPVYRPRVVELNHLSRQYRCGLGKPPQYYRAQTRICLHREQTLSNTLHLCWGT